MIPRTALSKLEAAEAAAATCRIIFAVNRHHTLFARSRCPRVFFVCDFFSGLSSETGSLRARQKQSIIVLSTPSLVLHYCEASLTRDAVRGSRPGYLPYPTHQDIHQELVAQGFFLAEAHSAAGIPCILDSGRHTSSDNLRYTTAQRSSAGVAVALFLHDCGNAPQRIPLPAHTQPLFFETTYSEAGKLCIILCRSPLLLPVVL